MSAARPTAKQAIEVLKVHQLRRENAVIFEEIKGLRADLASRQNELNDVRKEISELSVGLTTAKKSLSDDKAKLERFQSNFDFHEKTIAEAQQAHTSLRDEFTKTNAVSEVLHQQNGSDIKELKEQLIQLGLQVENAQKMATEACGRAPTVWECKADQKTVDELEDKLEDFMQEVDGQLEKLRFVDGPATGNVSAMLQEHPHDPLLLCENSNPERWKPIGTQDVFEASPMTVPETLSAAQPQDIETGTPNTLRSIGQEAKKVGAAAHEPPVLEYPQPRAQMPSLPVESKTDWNILNEILRLKQQEHEPLIQYHQRFELMTRTLLTDPCPLSACIRRFVTGLLDVVQKQFLNDWLQTGEWTLESVRDCILLMVSFHPDHKQGQVNLATFESRAPRRNDGGLEHSMTPRSHACLNGKTTPKRRPIANKGDKTARRFAEAETRSQRVQPARAAKTKCTAKVVVNQKRRYQTSTDHLPPSKAGVRVRKENGANTNQKLDNGMSHMSYKVLGDSPIQDVVRKPPEPPRKRKLEETQEDEADRTGLSSSPIAGSSEISPTVGKLRRIPELVKRREVKQTLIPETSDAVRLPPIRNDAEKPGEAGRDDRNRLQKRRRRTPPDIPILSLSTSDFRG